MITTYEPSMTMREARARYFEVNHFGADGGYGDAWVDFHLGPLPMPFPNSKGRKRAVPYHDLHHIVTGYDTNTTGEFEISAWEIGAGCKDHLVAWQINLGGLFGGVLAAPRRTFRAFVRGRRSQSLYGQALDGVLSQTVAEVRAQTGVDEPQQSASVRDVVLFVAAAAAGLVVGSLFAALTLPLVPVGLLAGALGKGKKSTQPA